MSYSRLRDYDLTVLKEMEKSFRDFKKLPLPQQKQIARDSLIDAGILDKNGNTAKIYRNLGG